MEKNIPIAPVRKLKTANRSSIDKERVVEERMLIIIKNGIIFWSVERIKMEGQLR